MGPAIRLAEPADAEPVRDVYAPIVEETAISFESDPPSTDAMADRIEATTERYPWLVCDDGDEVLGYASAGSHADRASYRWSVDVSVYVRPGARRRGIARGLYESLFAILREQGYVTACAVVALPNEASVRLHESLGFEPVGVFRNVGYKLGAWRDVGWWQLVLHPPPDDPDPPRPLRGTVDEPRFAEALAAGERDIDR